MARDALVEAALAEEGDVVLDHAADDLEAVAELCLQHVDVADAILEADDRRVIAAVLSDLAGGVGGGCALDGQGNDIGVGEDRRIVAIVDIVEMSLPAVGITERQAVIANVLGEIRAAD